MVKNCTSGLKFDQNIVHGRQNFVSAESRGFDFTSNIISLCCLNKRLRYFISNCLETELHFQVNKVHKITNGFTAFCTVHNSIICYLFSTNLVSISKFSLWLSHKVYFVGKYYSNVNIYIFKVVYLSSKFNVSVFNS